MLVKDLVPSRIHICWDDEVDFDVDPPLKEKKPVSAAKKKYDAIRCRDPVRKEYVRNKKKEYRLKAKLNP